MPYQACYSLCLKEWQNTTAPRDLRKVLTWLLIEDYHENRTFLAAHTVQKRMRALSNKGFNPRS